MTSSVALAKTEAVVVPERVSVRLQEMRIALQEETETRHLLKQFVEHHMVEGTDYGKIPGTDKPTLLKPGAEKLVVLLRCTPKFALIKNEEDFDRGFFNYVFRVRLYSRDGGGEPVAEGFGSANSREGRYRWRNANRKCPSCGKETIIKGKEEFGGGWVCWQKGGGGCKAKFAENAPEIVSQSQGKVENDDIATLANTILKMAKKRALVDGAIALARCSDLFTQDVEDLEHGVEQRPSPQGEPRQASRPAAAQAARTGAVSAPRTASARAAQAAAAKAAPSVVDAQQQQAKDEIGDVLLAMADLQERRERIRDRAKGYGFDADGFRSWVGVTLGSRKAMAAWTTEDCALMEAKLDGMEPPDGTITPEDTAGAGVA